MYQLDFDKPCHVHFIGIGGISMSGLASVLLDRGFEVSGSDSSESDLTELLRKEGAVVYIGQSAENIKDGIDLVVYTAAIKEDNPEFAEVIKRNIPMLKRAELLGQMMKNYDIPIAIAGTHGKTTTTSMVTEVLLAGGKDPTVSVGGMLRSINGNIRVGHSPFFVAEACEYTNSFLSFFPKVGMILNIEEDHMDFFKDINDIRQSFKKFGELVPSDGIVIINADIDDLDEITKDFSGRVITYGKNKNADYHPESISFDEFARPTFKAVSKEGEREFTLGVVGEHNVINALAAIALADAYDIPYEETYKALKNFTGTDRRFQLKGTFNNGVTIIDDYAHHPTEIEMTLKAAKAYPHKRLICAFQPHTYTRTKAFLDDFAKALSNADIIVLAEIYAAREKNTIGISSGAIKEKLDAMGKQCEYFHTFEEIENYLKKISSTGDLLITMGAGNIVDVGEDLLKE